MTHIMLYWNHICVLHRQEKAFLQELAGRLRREDIELEVRFFGLGYPEHMSEYLARPDAVLPDLIVSADLEVFENRDIFSKLEPELYPAADWVPLRESPALDAMRRGDKLLPAAAIPLVYYTREPELCEQMRLPDWEGLAFGGINNSAVKTVVKAVWEKWGLSGGAPGAGTHCPGALSLCAAGGRAERLPPHAPRGACADPVLSVRADLRPRVGGPAGGGEDLMPGTVRFLCDQRGSDPFSCLHPAAQQPRGGARLLPLRDVAGHTCPGRFLRPVLREDSGSGRPCSEDKRVSFGLIC